MRQLTNKPLRYCGRIGFFIIPPISTQTHMRSATASILFVYRPQTQDGDRWLGSLAPAPARSVGSHAVVHAHVVIFLVVRACMCVCVFFFMFFLRKPARSLLCFARARNKRERAGAHSRRGSVRFGSDSNLHAANGIRLVSVQRVLLERQAETRSKPVLVAQPQEIVRASALKRRRRPRFLLLLLMMMLMRVESAQFRNQRAYFRLGRTHKKHTRAIKYPAREEMPELVSEGAPNHPHFGYAPLSHWQ